MPSTKRSFAFSPPTTKASVIYPTCQDKFPAGECPHNFVNKEGHTQLDAIEYESKRIACPGHLLDSLPRQELVRRDGGMDKPDKVDFGKLDTKFVFRSWAELRAKWRTW